MFNDKNFDEFLHKAGQENKDLLEQYGPDFSKIEKGALSACIKNGRKHRRTVILRVAAACVGAVILLNAFLLFVEIEPVKAYQEQVKKFVFHILSDKTADNVESVYYKESEEIEKIQKFVPYKIPSPTLLPAGYSFNNVEMRDESADIDEVIIKYTNGTDTLVIDMDNGAAISDTEPSDGEGGYEQLKINGNDVYIVTLTTKQGARSKCHFYNKQGLNIYISAPVDKQSLVSVVESMK